MGLLANGLMTLGFLALWAGDMRAQGIESSTGTTLPAANEIAERMMVRDAERSEALEHYVAERTYRVDYHGIGGTHSGAIRVHVDYLSGKKQLTVISEEGSKLICERVLRKLVKSEEESSEKANQMQTTLSPTNYEIELLGEEVLDGMKTWVLHVSPRTENKFMYRGKVWVSQEDDAIMRVLGEPAKNPSWWISRASFDWRYARKGEFWLPERNVAKSHVRIGGDATLTIEYGEYQILSAKAVRPAAGEKVALSGTAPHGH